jgi:hypothetical protein
MGFRMLLEVPAFREAKANCEANTRLVDPVRKAR